jgi:uncharacterized SAM-binding protein YcdF (DUF218 family)
MEAAIDLVLFVIAKLVGAMVKIETWILVGLALAVFGLFRGRLGLARWSAVLTLGALLVLGFVPVYHPGLSWLEARHSAPDRLTLGQVDGIVVLGGAEQREGSVVWGQPQLNSGAERIVAGAALMLAHPQARLIHTGGSGSVADLVRTAQGRPLVTEAQIAQAVYLALGVPQARLELEPRARNTTENARFAFDLARPQPDETWLLVTSASHMPRAMASFRDAGWTNIQPWPVDYRSSRFDQNLNWDLLKKIELTNRTVHEGLGLLAGAMRQRLRGQGK